MPNTREKLIELLESAESAIYWNSSDKGFIEKIADHLIAHGVTFATDNKWIPVTERLPNEFEDVLVYRSTGCEVDSCVSHKKAYWSYDPVSDYAVTHWMPLPEPPKEV